MRILIASSIFPDAIQELRQQHDVICAFNTSEAKLKALIKDREVLIFRSGVSISSAVMQSAPQLRLLIRAGSGTDNLDLDYVRKRGLRLERIPEPGAKAVAELSFAFMLALARNLFQADRSLRQGRWTKYELNGFLLTGKVLGIVGAGNIGSRVGRLGAAWGMQVLGCVEEPTPELAAWLAARNIRLTDFDEVVSSADFLSLHVPLTDATKKMIGEEVFARMKAGSYLINLARGGVVDEQALHTALTKGDRLLGAALDVHECEGEGKVSPLASLPNVILTPHIGAQTVDSQREIGKRVLEIMDLFEADELECEAKETELVSAAFGAAL
ncbi:MAG: NAD(P)-dependent oxidoreductase [bacterium]